MMGSTFCLVSETVPLYRKQFKNWEPGEWENKTECRSPYIPVLGICFKDENVSVNVLCSMDWFKLEFSDYHVSTLWADLKASYHHSCIHGRRKLNPAQLFHRKDTDLHLEGGDSFLISVGLQILKSQRWLIPRYQRHRCGSVIDISSWLTFYCIATVCIFLGWDTTPIYCVGKLMHFSPSYGVHSGKD